MAIADPGDTLWTRTYGGSESDKGYSAQQTTDGGYIFTGTTQSFGAEGNDLYLIKTDANGDTLWTRAYGGINSDDGRSVRQTTDGGYIIAGYTNTFGAGNYDVYLIKTDASGDTLWTRTFGYGGEISDQGQSVQQTSDGGYIVVGHTGREGNNDVYLVKTDAAGDSLWTRAYGGSESDKALSVQQTADGSYIVAGYAQSFGAGGSDIYLLKTDATGDTLWTRTYGGSEDDEAYSVQQTIDGGYILAGFTMEQDDENLHLVKTDADGDVLWTRTYGGTSTDWANSVQQTTDGGYIIAGYTRSFGAGSYDVYLLKTDSSGDTLWTRTYGGIDTDRGYSVQQTADGGYIVGGQTRSFGAGSYDFYLLKIAGEAGLTVDFDIKPRSCPNPLNVRPYYNEEHQPRGVLPAAILGTEDFDVNDVDPTTVTLEGVSPLRWDYKDVAAPVVEPQGECDCTEDGPDGYLDLTLKFSRYHILEALGWPSNGEIPLTITGTLYDGEDFTGIDCVVIINSESAVVFLSQSEGSVAARQQVTPVAVPRSYLLNENHPNPFNAATTITYGLPEAGGVSLEVYNIVGQKVATLVDGKQEAGYKSVTWDASEVASGVYFYKLTAGDFNEIKRMTLVR